MAMVARAESARAAPNRPTSSGKAAADPDAVAAPTAAKAASAPKAWAHANKFCRDSCALAIV